MKVLGINAFHAGIEEERLNRIKHWAGFPTRAIETVLAMGGVTLEDVEHVAVSRDPKAHLLEKALFAFKHRPGLDAIRSRLKNHRRVGGLEELLAANVGHGPPFRGTVHNIEHHRAHLASGFYCSPFEEAACLTIDGFGDFLSSMSAVGRGTRLEILDDVMF